MLRILITTALSMVLQAAPNFKGCLRVSPGLSMARSAFYPKHIDSTEGKAVAMWSPTLSLDGAFGFCPKNSLVYTGVRVFSGLQRGSVEKRGWCFSPKKYWGLGLTTGVVVEDAFLTTVSFGVMRNKWEIGPSQDQMKNETLALAFVQIASETLLRKHFSTEVSYRYGVGLTQNVEGNHFTYRARPRTHAFALSVIFRA